MASNDRKQGIFNRRRFIKAGAAVAASGTMLPSSAQSMKFQSKKKRDKPTHLDPDIIFVNGKIHTMDSKNSIVSSVSIKDGRFVAVGSDWRGHRGPETRVIDLEGKMVVPGIIDNHNHLVLMGNRPGYHTPLENALSIPDVQAIYAARAAGIPKGAWITTIGGFHSNHIYANPADSLSGRLPTLAELDAAVPNNPVFIEVGFTGPSVTNSAGKAILQAAVVDGATITVADNGAIAGGTQSSRALLYLRRTLLNPEQRRRSVIDAMNYAASVGVTTHLDQGAFQATNTTGDGAAHEDNYTMHIPFLEVYGEGKGIVRLRINFLHMESDPNTPELVQRLKNAFPFFGDDMVRTGGIGEFIAQGTATTSPFAAAAKRVAQAGWRAEVHSLGRRNTPTSNPADFELEVMGFEAANAEFPGIVRETRWVIAHVPGITQEWIDRLQAIGGNLSLTGWQYLAGNPTISTVAPYAGPPFRMIVDSGNRAGGIHSGMSSDGMQIAPMNPWIHMYYATTGLNARKVLINPGQQITRQEVLELYTSKNGWFLQEEDQLGTIEKGKLADLAVLNNDYFAVANGDLIKIKSILTVVDGEVVYDTGVLDVDDRDRGHGRDRDRDDRGRDRD
jgi:predicted amidohydrolase YtcJ